jgi:hypothetical protein
MSDEQAQTETQADVQEDKAEVGVKSKKGSTGNTFSDVAKEVETLTKTKARNLALALSENIEANYFKLGGVLNVIKVNGWFEGHESFEVYVFEEFGFQKRKADYLMKLYTDLVGKQIPWEKVSHLGWTKIAHLSGILTLENLDEWVAKAEKCTVLELQAMLKAKPDAGGAVATTDEIETLKFKLHKDQAEVVRQALAKIRGEIQTEFDSVALENMAALILSGNAGTASVGGGDLKGSMAGAGWEAVLMAFGEMWPEIDLAVTLPEPAAGAGEAAA